MTDRAIVDEARRWLGTPYVHQASLRGVGSDCLGLVRGVWRELVGQEPFFVPAYSPDWAEVSAHEPLLSGLAESMSEAPDTFEDGQIIVFRMRSKAIAKHVAILCEAQRPTPNIIHAFSGHGVIEAPLNAGWRRRIAGRFQFPKRRP